MSSLKNSRIYSSLSRISDLKFGLNSKITQGSAHALLFRRMPPRLTRDVRFLEIRGSRNYSNQYNGVEVSETFMKRYKIVYALLLNAVFLGTGLYIGPQAISMFYGSKIDRAPTEWSLWWKRLYYIILYSEAHGSQVMNLLDGYKYLLVSILNSEDCNVTMDNVLTVTDYDFTNKSSEWMSALAGIYAKCADNLALLGNVKEAEMLYERSIQLNSRIDTHYGWACAGIAGIYEQNGDFSKAENFRLRSITAFSNIGILSDYHNLSVDEQVKLGKNLVIIPTDSSPTNDILNSVIDLGLLYLKDKKYEDALKAFVSASRIISEKQEPHIERYPELKLDLSEECRVKYYISETLWALKHQQEALDWCTMAYTSAMEFMLQDNTCAQCAKTTLSTISKMYKLMGQLEKSEQTLSVIERIPADETEKTSKVFGYVL
ncbi:hypothetical protein V1511DRAFT_494700 [Dipodascopsis uninucleata]